MEADCSFHIGYKVNANGLLYYMRITQRQRYHRESVGVSIMTEIGELFDRTV